MHLVTALALALAAVSPSSGSVLTERQDTCPSSDYIFKIDRFFLRKLDGQNISSLGFNIVATNGGSLDFACSPSDSAGNAVSLVQDTTYYSCGLNSAFSFSYNHESSGLILKYGNQIGTATLPNVCRAGGSTAADLVCTGVAPACITVVPHPAT